MGQLTVGEPLNWPETKKHAKFVRQQGVKQFIKLYHTFKQRDNDPFKYGDEIEYSLLKFDHTLKRVHVLLKAHELLSQLGGDQWTPEFGAFMVEGLPESPYDGQHIASICQIEPSMRQRRQHLQQLLGQDEYVMTITTFPMLGCIDYTSPTRTPTPYGGGITESRFFPDEAIYHGHPRYSCSINNNRQRSISKMCSHVPIFVDKCTPRPFVEDLTQYTDRILLNSSSASSSSSGIGSSSPSSSGSSSGDEESSTVSSLSSSTTVPSSTLTNCYEVSDIMSEPMHSIVDQIYLEGMGAACCCLQVTFQAKNLDEARFLYDQLAPLTPIVLALSAGSPIWRGYLSDIDCRWKPVSDALDDRTPEERSHGIIPKSRYDSIDCYLTTEGAQYNDIPVVMDHEFYGQLVANGVDHLMAQHVAHLFIRDPLVLFREMVVEQDAETLSNDTKHFENIQSTNWNTLRFKPPPKCVSNSATGWRVEFRTTELQLTDFENAAFVTFLVLVSRVIVTRRLNSTMLVNMSLVDDNMLRAQKRNACVGELYHFRCLRTGQVSQMTIDQIINGPGQLMSVIRDYVRELHVDEQTLGKIEQYLNFIEQRASGRLPTNAAWMRKFVMQHPNYAQDSRVTSEIGYDLMWQMLQRCNNNETLC